MEKLTFILTTALCLSAVNLVLTIAPLL